MASPPRTNPPGRRPASVPPSRRPAAAPVRPRQAPQQAKPASKGLVAAGLTSASSSVLNLPTFTGLPA